MNTKRTKSNKGTALLLAVVFMASGFMLAACGDGGGSGSSTPSLTPSSTSGLSRGEIQGFGSIIVNGVRFNDDSASVEFENGESARDLQEGMIVEIEGTFDDSTSTGTATTVRASDSVEGPAVLILDGARAKTLSVLGQTVIVEDGVTVFDNSGTLSFATLTGGETLEVSGMSLADGTIMATFIQEKAAGGLLEVKGSVSALNTTAQTFMINNLNVDYSTVGADSTEDVALLANGLVVEVKGTAFDPATVTLTATVVEAGPDDLNDDIAKVQFEGFISALTSSTFILNGQTVNYSGAAFFGGIVDDLADGVRVQAEGPFTAGVLVATKVKFKETIRIEGNAVNSQNGTFTIEGLNLTIATDATLTDGSLADGTDIKLRARMSGDTILAIRIDDDAGDNASDRVILQAPATVNGDIVTLLGIDIDTSTITENSIDDSPGDTNFEIEDTPVTRAEFLAALNNGDIVKARADLTGLVWNQIEIEQEDD